MLSTYCGSPLTEEHIIHSELVSKVIFNLHCGKAPDAAGLTAEHIRYSHRSLPVILCKFVRLMMLCKYVPSGFCNSYIFPVPEIKDCRLKTRSMFRRLYVCKLRKHGRRFCLCETAARLWRFRLRRAGYKFSYIHTYIQTCSPNRFELPSLGWIVSWITARTISFRADTMMETNREVDLIRGGWTISNRTVSYTTYWNRGSTGGINSSKSISTTPMSRRRRLLCHSRVFSVPVFSY